MVNRIMPDPDAKGLTKLISGLDHKGQTIEKSIITEKPLTIYLNKQEVITLMTIGDHPKYLALGFLVNQNMLTTEDIIKDIQYDDDLQVVVITTSSQTNFEQKLAKKIRTSGCAQGTIFGDIMENFQSVILSPESVVKTSWIYNLSYKINHIPSLYIRAGAIHGCVLAEKDEPLVYMEDVGRHNAVDKIAGYMFMHGVKPEDKMFYTTGRLTSEMVIKTVNMNIPILLSRSGFTSWGVELAQQVGLTLVGRAKAKRFIALSGFDRIVYDTVPEDG